MQDKKCPWIPEDLFQELERSIWLEIDQQTNHKKKSCPIKQPTRKKSKLQDKKDNLGIVNVVCQGDHHIIIG